VASKKRVHIYYSGRVQEVGFRYTTIQVAQDLGLNGWVRNLPNGQVELVAEGDEELLKDLDSKIKNSIMGQYITGSDITFSNGTDEFKSFEITF